MLPVEWRAPRECLCSGARLVQGWDTETGGRFVTPCPHCTHSGPIRDRLEKTK